MLSKRQLGIPVLVGVCILLTRLTPTIAARPFPDLEEVYVTVEGDQLVSVPKYSSPGHDEHGWTFDPLYKPYPGHGAQPLWRTSGAQREIEERFFDQKVDHFHWNGCDNTFKQRFFVNDAYCKEGNCGVVILVVGPDRPLDPDLIQRGSLATRIANAFKGFVVALEFRYFGKSVPFGPGQLTLEELSYLNSQQVIADYAYFASAFPMEPFSQLPWIVLGPSAVPAVYRIKYPFLSTGSVASGAIMDITSTPKVNRLLHEVTPQECAQDLVTVFQKANQLAQDSRDIRLLSKLFSFLPYAKFLEPDSSFLGTFFDDISKFYSHAARFDYETPEVWFNDSRPLEALCSQMDRRYTAGQLLEEFAHWSRDAYAFQTSRVPSTVERRHKAWRACTEFGFLNVYDPVTELFSPTVSEERFLADCQKEFEVPIEPDQLGMYELFGGLEVLAWVSRILFTNGETDHYRSLSPSVNYGNTVRAMTIPHVGYAADMYPNVYYPDPPTGLINALGEIIDVIGCFLHCPREPEPSPHREPLKPPNHVLAPLTIIQVVGLMVAVVVIAFGLGWVLTIQLFPAGGTEEHYTPGRSGNRRRSRGGRRTGETGSSALATPLQLSPSQSPRGGYTTASSIQPPPTIATLSTPLLRGSRGENSAATAGNGGSPQSGSGSYHPPSLVGN